MTTTKKNPLEAPLAERTYDLRSDRGSPRPKPPRYSISVSGKRYEQLRALAPGSVASFVDEFVLEALDEPAISTRILAACRQSPR